MNGGGRFLADTYCGVGRVGRSAECRGFAARFHDLLIHRIEGDMTREKNLRFLVSCARTGKLMGFMFAPLCASWSQARNRTNVIRNYAYPWGLPQSERGEKAGRRLFSLNDQAALDVGNKTMSSALRLATSVHRTGIFGSLRFV